MMFAGIDLQKFWDSLDPNFVSLYYLVFLALTVWVYYIVSEKCQWIILLAASTGFYLLCGLRPFVIVLLTAFVTWLSALFIAATEKINRRKKRFFLSMAMLAVLAVLSYVKILRFLGWGVSFIVPLGISYYTFSLIGYLADVYWGKEPAQRNFFKLALFVLFFPKIIQGPISKHRNLTEQFAAPHRFDYQQITFGLQRMLWGYFKKLVIADRLTLLIAPVIENHHNHGGALLMLMVVLSEIRLYCDFSGYMDIALGTAQLFGITMEENFKQPFFSKSAAEFWRRWHITLGAWFKDYVYMPLVVSPSVIKVGGAFRKYFGKSAGKAVMTVIPLSAVWLLTGVWHGTGKDYVLWGVYWGTLIILSNLFSKTIQRMNEVLRINTKAPSWNVFQMVRTFVLCVFAHLLVMPGDFQISSSIMKKLVHDMRFWELADGTIRNLGMDQINIYVLIFSIVILWIVDLVREKYSVREKISQWNAAIRILFYCLAVIAVLVLGIYGSNYGSVTFAYANY